MLPVRFKPMLAAAALFAVAGSSYVYAQQGFGDHRFGDGGPRMEFRHHRPSAADVAAFTDARIAALKAGLELTPDQAKNWPPFEQAVRDLAQLRQQRIQAREAGDQQAPATPFDRLARRADSMAKASAALKKVADAGAPLYQSLNDDQKGRFVRLSHMLRPHWRMRAMMEHRWREAQGDGPGGHGWHPRNPWGHNGPGFGQPNEQDGGDQGDQGSRL
jgi:zinc resistance-associated protein